MPYLEFEKVRYKNKYYAVISVFYRDLELPVVIDWNDLKLIKNLDKNSKSNRNGFISCKNNYNGNIRDVYMHEIIMAIKMKNNDQEMEKSSIVHINRIGLDNRKENLIFDNKQKLHNKNIKKKRRTITLPQSSGIKPNDIPTYVWYMKPNGTHGERFMVDIGNIKWKTTASKKLSLRYKLEEAKLFLRQLKDQKPELFQSYSMNGDFTKKGLQLIDSYYDIIARAGFDHIQKFIPKNNTKDYLKPGEFSRKEKTLLKNQGNLIKDGPRNNKRRVFNKLPKDANLKQSDMPKYCYYKPETKIRGDHFIINGHPNQMKSWRSTSSKLISVNDKYQEMITQLNKFNDEVYSTESSSSHSST